MMLDASPSGKHPGQQKTVQEIPVIVANVTTARNSGCPRKVAGDQKPRNIMTVQTPSTIGRFA
jgi:hypothetical protein